MTTQDLKFPRIKWKYLAKEKMMYGANESAELDDPSLPRYIRITDLDMEGNLKEETFKSLEWEKARSYLLQKGDVLLARSGATVGKAYIHEEDISACFAGYLIKLKVDIKKVYPKFLYYYTQTKEYAAWISENTIQATIQNVSAEKYANLEMPLPSLFEQQIITSFLNKETKNINEIVRQKERLLALLEEKRQSMITEAVTKGLNPNVKMKDSGVEWIGEIPEHWNMKKMKYFIETTKGFAFKSEDFTESGIPVVKTTDIKNNTIVNLSNTFVAEDKYEGFEKIRVFKGDILMSTVGSAPHVINSAVGQLGLVSTEFDGALLNQNAVKLEANNNIVLSKYLFYLLCNKRYREYLNIGAHGTANQASLSLDYILNFLASLPPLEEQDEILKVLDYKTSQIDEIINNIREQTQKLKDYRQSLIYEAVTGKIDVRNFKVDAE